MCTLCRVKSLKDSFNGGQFYSASMPSTSTGFRPMPHLRSLLYCTTTPASVIYMKTVQHGRGSITESLYATQDIHRRAAEGRPTAVLIKGWLKSSGQAVSRSIETGQSTVYRIVIHIESRPLEPPLKSLMRIKTGECEMWDGGT
jgi:hypothetical protein